MQSLAIICIPKSLLPGADNPAQGRDRSHLSPFFKRELDRRIGEIEIEGTGVKAHVTSQ